MHAFLNRSPMKTRYPIDTTMASIVKLRMQHIQAKSNGATMRSRPLSLVRFRALEAVARHLNFRAAAQELALTQSAVSRQIQSLEEEIGVPLFVRHTRVVELTSAGALLLRAVVPSLERVDSAVRQIRAHAGRQRIVVTTWASFASMWLIPRLELFQADHRDFDIHIHTTDLAVDLESSDADIALRYTHGSGVPHGSIKMFGEKITAAASPWLLKDAAPLHKPEDLKNFTLIEAGDTHTSQNLEWLTWHGWVQSHHLKKFEPKRWIYFDFAHQMAQAALTGQGIALLRMPLIADSLALGELVEAFPDLRVDSPMSYWLAIAERSKARPEINALSSWLLAQARLTRLTMGDKS
jgi:LysR family glycine cleavage system transcriptional activator